MDEPKAKLIIIGAIRTYEFTTEEGVRRLIFYDPKIKEPLRYVWEIQNSNEGTLGKGE